MKERCEVFLGDAKGDKTIVSDLYSRRSGIIHGQMNMPFGFGFNEQFAEVLNGWKKVWFLNASVPIFIATLQKMVELDIHQLQFELRLKKKKKMNVTANGKPIESKLPCTLQEFLVAQNLLPRSVVVEHNGKAVAPSEFSKRQLAPGDRLEIVKIVAGG